VISLLYIWKVWDRNESFWSQVTGEAKVTYICIRSNRMTYLWRHVHYIYIYICIISIH
jgi:hypothetical protein